MAPRRLLLIRHARAGDAPLDRDRPLTAHGTDQARALGAWLAERSLARGRVLLSPARRAQQTWAEVAARLAAAAEPTVDARIYDNTLDTVLEAIRETPDEVRCLAVVGHNPSLGALAGELAAGSLEHGFPAGAAALFELPGTFAGLEPGSLSDLHLPDR